MRILKVSTPSAALLFAVALVSAVSAAAEDAKPAAANRLSLETCRLPGLDEDVRCGTYEVYENRASRKGRKIPLRVVVLPARGADPSPEPVFYFEGGPGGSAVETGPGLSYALADLRRRRDLVLVDQRGTGESNALMCPYQKSMPGIEEALESFLPIEDVRECRAELEKRADLTRYTTADAVDDFDEVRAALGYGKIHLMGGSYGSRVVQTYLRRHPDSVATATIEGVVPFDARMPLTFARDAQRALDGLFAECAADEACHAAFPDPRADLAAVLAKLDRGPVTVTAVDPKSGDERKLEVSRNVFIQTLRYMTYDPLSALQVPLFLHRAAAAGDFEPLGQMAYASAGGIFQFIAGGLYLSVTCAEDVAYIDPAAIAEKTAGTYLGDFRIRQQRAACAEWPRAELPEGFTEPVRSDKPVLLISGERDPVTPSSWGEQVARHLSRSRHMVVPDGAHGFFGLPGAECLDRLTTELFEQGDVEGLDTAGCAASIRRPPFPLEIAEDEAVTLTEDELRRFPGSYVSEKGGLELVITFADGGLRADMGDLGFRLVPVAPRRFALLGEPPGSYLDFDAEITRLAVIKVGTSLFDLRRKP